jgi:hypothetical protein
LRKDFRNVLVVGKKNYYPLEKISSHKFSTYEYGIVYDFFLPVTQRNLSKIGLFPIKIPLASR